MEVLWRRIQPGAIPKRATKTLPKSFPAKQPADTKSRAYSRRASGFEATRISQTWHTAQ
ncbi:hypothetical protein GCM10010197_09300 [Nocardioides luteus]|uniref:Uncharacterized protein n=1 Tax=Nocardioides luteus TaxID=1844 RepID=A0ABQ5SY87_9ACTN|nr:hypothetical protein GCM10010197_09300 [Nocardioides luteus]GLJ68794.1 hypothetical protein GCM10017579_28300 [Nocardioides luteus]